MQNVLNSASSRSQLINWKRKSLTASLSSLSLSISSDEYRIPINFCTQYFNAVNTIHDGIVQGKSWKFEKLVSDLPRLFSSISKLVKQFRQNCNLVNSSK